MPAIRSGLLVFVAALLLVAAPSSAVPPGRKLTWQGGGRGRVVFEGKEHAEKGYGCDACHPGLFQRRQGAATMTMAAMNEGRLCGACHDGVTAFGTADPKKCHECHRKAKGGERDHHEGREHRERREHREHDDD